MAIVNARHMFDKSALARMQVSAVAERLGPLIEAGEVATCAIIDLEVLFSARNYEEYERMRARRSLAYTLVSLSDEIFDRAFDVQARLAKTGQHRLPIPDLIIAAAAESAGLILLHYDADFERIAAITGQAIEWVVPRGSI
jgi:predicted nucleic acid-binding protein